MGLRPVKKVIQTDNFEITIHVGTLTEYHGSFEHNDFGDECGGELWFDPMGELVDYDGVYELPKEVAAALKAEGYWGEAL
jgi:hypothetical protein